MTTALFPPVQVRRLIIFAGDTRDTDWSRAGKDGPDVPHPPGVVFQWLREGAVLPGQVSRYAGANSVKARFAAGDACLAGLAEDGQLVYHLWVTERGAHIEWIFGRVAPRPGEMMVYDVWTDPDWRGGHLHAAGSAEACREAARRGAPVIVGGVERKEFRAFAKLYRRAGIGPITAARAILGIRLLVWSVRIPVSPPSGLQARQG